MNWLAHLHLSDPTPAFRLGSLLPDIVDKPVLVNLPAEFQPGIRRHVQIDVFTDSHPIFRRSVARLKPPYRRFGGILVDVFYDHFLASHWANYSNVPLPDFTMEVYTTFQSHSHLLPETARLRLHHMQTEDWLGSYRTLDGIAATLNRISRRLSRPVDLAQAVRQLEDDFAGFYADFKGFYPELQSHV